MADPLPIIPPKENLQTVIGSNTIGGYVEGEETVPIDSLSGGISTSKRAQDTVKDIAAQMSSPSGYIERLIVDQDGNVIEGAHRLEALRKIGIEEIPVTRIVDPTSSLDLVSMKKAIKGVGKIHPDHINQIMSQIGDMLRETGNNPNKVLTDYTFPKGYEKYFKAALTSLELDEPRSTDLVEYAPIPEPVKLPSTDLVEHRPGLPRLTGVGRVLRGLGSMIGGPKLRAVRGLITMAQQGYELLPEEQQLLGDVLDMEALTKQIPGTGRGLEYFRQLLGMKPRSPDGDVSEGILALPDVQEKLELYHAGPTPWFPEEGYPAGRANLDYLLTGEGFSAYGPGFYAAEARDLAKDAYKNPEGLAKLLEGGFEPKVEYAFSLLENGANASDVMKNMFNKYEYEGIGIDTIMESIDAARDAGAGRGALYKLEIPTAVEKDFLDWDAPLSQQPKVLDKLIRASEMSREELMELGRIRDLKEVGEEGYVKDHIAFLDMDVNTALGTFLKRMEQDPGTKMRVPIGWSSDSTMEIDVSRLRGGDLLFALGKDKKAVEFFDKAGIKGMRYLDERSRPPRYRNPNEPWPKQTRNRVIWNQDLLNTVSRGIKREMAAGGFIDKPLYDRSL